MEAVCQRIPCQRMAKVRGFCKIHYNGARNRGLPNLPRLSLLERFESKYIPEPMSGCWIWIASLAGRDYKKEGKGYGQFVTELGRIAHRVAYQLYRGPIPAGLQLDHLCVNPGCVNPWHLEAVTLAENLLRGVNPPARNKRKTHCNNGHELSGTNLVLTNKGCWRKCRICYNQMQRLGRKRRKEAREYLSPFAPTEE